MSSAFFVISRLREAHARRALVPSPSALDPELDLGSAYEIEREFVRIRAAEGHRAVGVKVGFANKAVWRALKLETVVWGHMYDDTVHFAEGGHASLALNRFTSPKIEPEIIFTLRSPLAAGLDAAGALASVESMSLGFEIIDCVYPDWKFHPVDFVAGFGLHAGLIVGEPVTVEPAMIPQLVEALARFTVQLRRNDELVAEGGGKNVLRSPALGLAELGSAMARQPSTDTLAAGEYVSSGTLTESKPIAAGETWTATVEGIELSPVTLRTT
jgi:2-oxo-3-hexenedioate decarboxylase